MAGDRIGEATPGVAALTAQLAERQPEFVAFVERRLRDRALAEDVVQDAFVRSMDKLRDLRDPGAAVAWFYRMLRNAVIDHQRRHATAGRALQAFASELETVGHEGEVHRAVCRCVSDLAQALKPEYGAALQRIEVEGVSVKDYAGEVGITPNNAAVRVFRARAALERRVRTTCGACAARGCVECTCGR